MRSKFKFIGTFFILFIICIASLNTKINSKSYNDEINKSINNYISEKSSTYNYLNDKQFVKKLEDFVKLELKDNYVKNKNYAFGYLTNSTIPDIAIFKQRDYLDLNDEGFLEIYTFKDNKYSLLDKISMNYDNYNYDIKIGRISNNKNGIFLSNQVGAHSGLTYGFIIEDSKLKNILNHNKVNLLSIYAKNEIKDFDNDGILEFSVYTIDPEDNNKSIDEADKIHLWYKWDEDDSANIIAIQRDSTNNKDLLKISNVDKVNTAKSLISMDTKKFLSYLNKNKSEFNKQDTDKLIDLYIKHLNINKLKYSEEIKSIFSNYNITYNSELIYNLNQLEYLDNSEKLVENKELRKVLKNNYKLGYIFDYTKDNFYYEVNYDFFISNYKKYITKEYKDYLDILSTKAVILNDNEEIYMELLAKKIVNIDNFKNRYPYSEHIKDLNNLQKQNLDYLFYGSIETPHIINNNIKPKVYSELVKLSSLYKDTNLSNIIDDFIDKINKNNLSIEKTSSDNLKNRFQSLF